MKRTRPGAHAGERGAWLPGRVVLKWCRIDMDQQKPWRLHQVEKRQMRGGGRASLR